MTASPADETPAGTHPRHPDDALAAALFPMPPMSDRPSRAEPDQGPGAPLPPQNPPLTSGPNESTVPLRVTDLRAREPYVVGPLTAASAPHSVGAADAEHPPTAPTVAELAAGLAAAEATLRAAEAAHAAAERATEELRRAEAVQERRAEASAAEVAALAQPERLPAAPPVFTVPDRPDEDIVRASAIPDPVPEATPEVEPDATSDPVSPVDAAVAAAPIAPGPGGADGSGSAPGQEPEVSADRGGADGDTLVMTRPVAADGSTLPPPPFEPETTAPTPSPGGTAAGSETRVISVVDLTDTAQLAGGALPPLPAADHALVGLRARSVSAWFGDHKVLDGVSLTIAPGEVTALIGPSGCGKSTFLRILNRMHEMIKGASLAGEVLLGDEDIYDPKRRPSDVRRRIGMVFQRPNPFPAMSIYENVTSGLKLAGISCDDKDSLVEQSLARAGLWQEVKDRLHTPGGALSGGQQQRLCIARSLTVSPDVLLMDEPCSALDPTSTRRVEDTIHELRGEVTIAIVTHNMQQAARVSRACAFFLATHDTPGHIVEAGPTDQIFNAPQDSRTADYVNGRFG